MARNAAHVVGIELLAAAQGCDVHLPPPRAQSWRRCGPGSVPVLDHDHYLAPEIEAATALVTSGAVAEAVGLDMLPGVAEAV